MTKKYSLSVAQSVNSGHWYCKELVISSDDADELFNEMNEKMFWARDLVDYYNGLKTMKVKKEEPEDITEFKV